MKTLYLIRHAKSSWANMGQRDFDRPLDERGHRDAPRMAQLLRGMGVQPDVLVSSPARRALTTAQYFADAFGIAHSAIITNMDIYEANVSDILHIVEVLPDDCNTVLMYGHNPTFTYVANRFSDKMIDNVPTCGIVKIVADTDKWANFIHSRATLTDFWYPKGLND